MAKNCHAVLSWLLESIREPSEVPTHANPAAEQLRLQNLSQVELGPSGQKRPRGDQTPRSFEGPDSRRVRLSDRDSQLPQWAVPASEDHTQPSQPRNSGFDNNEINYQHMDSAANMISQAFPAMQYPDCNNTLPGSLMYQDSPHGAQRSAPRIAPPFVDTWNDEWTERSRTVPTINPPLTYDVFDGAMWGSLLEMVDPNG